MCRWVLLWVSLSSLVVAIPEEHQYCAVRYRRLCQGKGRHIACQFPDVKLFYIFIIIILILPSSPSFVVFFHKHGTEILFQAMGLEIRFPCHAYLILSNVFYGIGGKQAV